MGVSSDGGDGGSVPDLSGWVPPPKTHTSDNERAVAVWVDLAELFGNAERPPDFDVDALAILAREFAWAREKEREATKVVAQNAVMQICKCDGPHCEMMQAIGVAVENMD